MKNVLVFAALGEAAMGLALLVMPSLAGQLLLGEQLAGIAIPVARVAGIALVALGIACWPGPPRAGMLTYGAAVMLYLGYLGMAGGQRGILLWPAVILHAIVTILLVWVSARRQESKPSRQDLESRKPLGEVPEERAHQRPWKGRHETGLDPRSRRPGSRWAVAGRFRPKCARLKHVVMRPPYGCHFIRHQREIGFVPWARFGG